MGRARLFGPVIRGRRRQLGLSMDALGRKVQVHGNPISKGYLSGIENQKVSPPADDIVIKLARALGLPRERLLLLAHLDKLPQELFDTYPLLRALRDEASGPQAQPTTMAAGT
jgi:transcriptional regulator with XRE-family HTH domain